MNQSTTSSSSSRGERESSLLTCAAEDEFNVSQILLDLRNLMSLSESLAKFNWGRKRRRSCLDAAPPLPSAASRPSTSVQKTENEIEQGRAHTKAEAAVVVEKHDGAARTTASPDTPFSFSISPSDESDEKSKHSSKITSKKMSREEYLDMMEGLTRTKFLLRGELEKVKKHRDKLESYNSQLKAFRKQVQNSSLRKEVARMEISGGGVSLGIELTQHYRANAGPHQQLFTADLMAQNIQYSVGPITAHSHPSNNGLGSVNYACPLGFDLNVPAEEAFGFGVDLSQPFDAIADKRARFAEARRKRRGIVKIKNKSTRNGVLNH